MAYVLRDPKYIAVKAIDIGLSYISYPSLLYIPSIDSYVIDIPKNGSSYLKSALIATNNVIFSRGHNFPHSTVFFRPKLTTLNPSKKIYAFVRDPIDRFKSTVAEKLIISPILNGKWSPFASPFARKYKLSELDELVVDFTAVKKTSRLDYHLIPQSEFIRPYAQSKNIELLHVSHISEFISQNLNLSLDDLSMLNQLSSSKAKHNVKLSSEIIIKLKEFYIQDFTIAHQRKPL